MDYSLLSTHYSLLLVHLTLINHTHRLAFRNRECALREQLDVGREQDFVLQRALYAVGKFLQAAEVIGEEFLQFHFNGHVVVVGIRSERNEVIVRQLGESHKDLLNLNREDVHPAKHHHVVTSTSHAVNAHMVATTRTRATEHTG